MFFSLTGGENMNIENIDVLAKKIKAIASDKRLSILYQIFDKELSVGDIEKKVDLSQSALSQHLAVLREEDVVKTKRSAQTIYYSLKDEKIRKILELLNELYL